MLHLELETTVCKKLNLPLLFKLSVSSLAASFSSLPFVNPLTLPPREYKAVLSSDWLL